MKYIIIFEINCDNINANLYALDFENLKFINSSIVPFKVINLGNGGSESKVDEIFNAFIKSCKDVIKTSKINPNKIDAISFTSKSSNLVLVDVKGKPIYNVLNYLDRRAEFIVEKELYSGIKHKGVNAFKYYPSKRIAGFISTNVTDLIYKYNWIRTHEREIYKDIYKLLDIKGYLILKCTNKFAMSSDEAIHTGLVDNRKKELIFSKKLCKVYSINYSHLPTIVKPEDIISKLDSNIAEKLGLNSNTKVIIGGNEHYLLPLGIGSVRLNESLIYLEDSGVYLQNINNRKFDIKTNSISYNSVKNNIYNYISVVETANKCLKWIDTIFIESITLKDVDKILSITEPGSNGVIFTPWLEGKPSPINSDNLSGLYFGLSLKTTKNDLIRAVVEGMFYQFRWIIEKQNKNEKNKKAIKLISPYLNSDAFYQMGADILGYPIEIIENPDKVIVQASAYLAGKSLGVYKDYENSLKFSKVIAIYKPDKKKKAEYEYLYQIFIRLYKSNKDHFINHKKKTVNYRSGILKSIDSAKFILLFASAAIIELFFDFLFSKYVLNLSPWLSYTLAASISLVYNFTINRKVTFYGAPNVPKAMILLFSFYLVFIPSTAILKSFLTDGNFFEFFTIFHLNLENTIATIICLIISTIFEYGYQKLVVFRKIKSNKYKIVKDNK